jgi:hypothetical protein
MTVRDDRLLLASTIEQFVGGTSGAYDWDDVLGIPFSDPYVESIRLACLDAQRRFPAEDSDTYCNSEGASHLLSLAARLRRGI